MLGNRGDDCLAQLRTVGCDRFADIVQSLTGGALRGK